MSALTEDRRSDGILDLAHLPPRVDLLPPEISRRHGLRRLQLGVGCGLLAAVGVVASLTAAAAGAVQDANGELAVVSARGAALQTEITKYVDVLAVHREAQAAQDMLTLAMGEEVRFSALLDDLSRTVPDNVWLEDVTFTQGTPASPAAAGGEAGIGTATFTGVAFSHDDVAAWLDSLAAREGYAEPSLTESTAATGSARRTVTFTSTVALTSAALSGRHAPTTAED